MTIAKRKREVRLRVRSIIDRKKALILSWRKIPALPLMLLLQRTLLMVIKPKIQSLSLPKKISLSSEICSRTWTPTRTVFAPRTNS
jgi:hypothetical protein